MDAEADTVLQQTTQVMRARGRARILNKGRKVKNSSGYRSKDTVI